MTTDLFLGMVALAILLLPGWVLARMSRVSCGVVACVWVVRGGGVRCVGGWLVVVGWWGGAAPPVGGVAFGWVVRAGVLGRRGGGGGSGGVGGRPGRLLVGGRPLCGLCGGGRGRGRRVGAGWGRGGAGRAGAGGGGGGGVGGGWAFGFGLGGGGGRGVFSVVGWGWWGVGGRVRWGGLRSGAGGVVAFRRGGFCSSVVVSWWGVVRRARGVVLGAGRRGRPARPGASARPCPLGFFPAGLGWILLLLAVAWSLRGRIGMKFWCWGGGMGGRGNAGDTRATIPLSPRYSLLLRRRGSRWGCGLFGVRFGGICAGLGLGCGDVFFGCVGVVSRCFLRGGGCGLWVGCCGGGLEMVAAHGGCPAVLAVSAGRCCGCSTS